MTIVQKNKKTELLTLLDSKKDEIQKVLPKFLSQEKLMRVALTEFNKNEKLLQCQPNSIYGAIMQAAELGLMPSSVTREAYLVPYGETCTLQIGYQGLLALAYRTGKYSYIEAQEVYTNDKFEYELGSNPKITHIPATTNRGEIIGYYAIAYLKDSSQHPFKYMSTDEIDEHKNKYARKDRNGKNNFWDNHLIEMAKKTVIRKLLNTASRSTEDHTLMQAINLDYQNDVLQQEQTMIEIEKQENTEKVLEEI